MNLEDIIKKYNNNENSELEYVFSNINSYIFSKVKKYLLSQKFLSSNEESIHIISNSNNKLHRITKFYEKGVIQKNKTEYMIKYKLIKPYIEKDVFRINLKAEEICNKFEINNIDLIRIKLRKSFILEDLPNWRFDLDIIKEIKEFYDSNIIKFYIQKLFVEENFKLNDDYIYSLECEYIGDKQILNNENILEPKYYFNNIINKNYVKKIEYQKYIYKIATYIVQNKYLLNKFKSESGFKRLSNNVSELNRNVFSNIVLPNINYFYLTDKIDGLRSMIIIEIKQEIINIKIVSDKLYFVKEYQNEIRGHSSIYIFDAEMLITTKNEIINEEISLNDLKLYVFDVIVFNSENISNKPFEQRLNYFEDVNEFLKKYNIGETKTFLKLTDNYKNEIEKFYNESLNKKEYEIDGLIFTPNSKLDKLNENIYKKARNKKINNNYSNTVSYKWKPPEKITIDFYMIELKEEYYKDIVQLENYDIKNKKVIILFSGIDRNTFSDLKINLLSIYKNIIPSKYFNNQYFPIQFSPSDDPYKYIFVTDIKEDLNGKVGEFKFNKQDDKWEFLNLRLDRDIEIERGEYFGNSIKIAEYLWNSIKNPLTFEDIINKNITKYFAGISGDIYKPQRIYNSYVKNKLLYTVLNNNIYDLDNSWVIDLAAGKGQDLARLANLGFKKGLFIDIDSDALYELIERKYNLRLNFNKSLEMEIYTKQLDLKNNYNDNLKKLKMFEIKEKTVDVIICNFAFHYFTDNYNNLNNMINFIDKLINKNGLFIMTVFDGNKIFKLLKSTEYYNLNENDILKYSLKKLYKSNTITDLGQKIGTLLPFSKNEYYEEYLVNIDYITKEFNKKGFNVEYSDSFSIFENNFKLDNKEIFNKLSDNDKIFNSLYSFLVIQKVKEDPIIINKQNNKLLKSLKE